MLHKTIHPDQVRFEFLKKLPHDEPLGEFLGIQRLQEVITVFGLSSGLLNPLIYTRILNYMNVPSKRKSSEKSVTFGHVTTTRYYYSILPRFTRSPLGSESETSNTSLKVNYLSFRIF